MAMNRTHPIISAAWSSSNVKLTMWRQLLFELKLFCCVLKTMNNSLYTPYVGVGSRAAGRSTILRLRSNARQSLVRTHTSSTEEGGYVWGREPPPKYHSTRCVCIFVWVKEWGCLHVTSKRVSVHLRRWHLCTVSVSLFPGCGTIHSVV